MELPRNRRKHGDPQHGGSGSSIKSGDHSHYKSSTAI